MFPRLNELRAHDTIPKRNPYGSCITRNVPWWQHYYPRMSTSRNTVHRLSKALGTAKNLITFWKDVKCDIKWKLQVYNAVIVTQLTYALDSVFISTKMANKLDAFQNRSLRFILGIEPSYWSRVTNEEVLRRANLARDSIPEIEWGDMIINHEIKNGRIRKVSDILKDRRLKLLGHVMRAAPSDPMHMVTFNENQELNRLNKRRRGKLRHHWTHQALQEAMEAHYNMDYDPTNDLQIAHLILLASERAF